LNFIETIEEHSLLNFTGRINILQGEMRKFCGAVYLLSGDVVYSQYLGEISKHTIYKIVVDDIKNGDLSFVPEPEVIDASMVIIQVSLEEIRLGARAYIESIQKLKKHEIPETLNLKVKNTIFDMKNMSYDEFHTLTLVSDFYKVSEIISNSEMEKTRILTSLIKLREKKALRVSSRNSI
jgi:hypothetical protein